MAPVYSVKLMWFYISLHDLLYGLMIADLSIYIYIFQIKASLLEYTKNKGKTKSMMHNIFSFAAKVCAISIQNAKMPNEDIVINSHFIFPSKCAW